MFSYGRLMRKQPVTSFHTAYDCPENDDAKYQKFNVKEEFTKFVDFENSLSEKFLSIKECYAAGIMPGPLCEDLNTRKSATTIWNSVITNINKIEKHFQNYDSARYRRIANSHQFIRIFALYGSFFADDEYLGFKCNPELIPPYFFNDILTYTGHTVRKLFCLLEKHGFDAYVKQKDAILKPFFVKLEANTVNK